MMSAETTALLFCVLAATVPIAAVLASLIIGRAIREAATIIGGETQKGAGWVCEAIEAHSAQPAPPPASETEAA